MIPTTSAPDLCGTRAARDAGGAPATAGAILGRLDRAIDRLVERLFVWQRRIADRRALESLDDRMLRDIGLSRADVFVESRKPFWRS
ncbi:MAG: DUF1127 domain-containing protein [Rhodospirillaceae bacterium]|nr:DUF1127 domain-containing protein [Rhodospirillaceae bacterium]